MRAGSLCSGVLGLDLAVEAVFGTELAWCAEIDKHAAEVIAARAPGVPNLGDIKDIDWDALRAAEEVMPGEPVVDVLTAGFP